MSATKKLLLCASTGVAVVWFALPSRVSRVAPQEASAADAVLAPDGWRPLQPAGSSEPKPVGPLWEFWNRLGTRGPAAKGEIDELLIEWRALLASSDPAQLARALSPDELATLFGTAALEAWLAQDSTAASAWIAAQPASTDQHAWLVAAALTRQPDILAKFSRRLGDTSWAQAFLDYSGRELLRSDPAATIALAESLASGERQTRLFETIACDWMLRDPGAARAWINRVRDPVLRQRLVAIGAQSYASIDPLGAVEWLLAQSAHEAVPENAIRSVAQIGLHTADRETGAWLSALLASGDGRTDPVTRNH